MKTHRFTVTLETAQVAELNRLAKAQGISASALVRNAVGRLLSDRAIFLPAVLTDSTQQHASQLAEAHS